MKDYKHKPVLRAFYDKTILKLFIYKHAIDLYRYFIFTRVYYFKIIIHRNSFDKAAEMMLGSSILPHHIKLGAVVGKPLFVSKH